MGFKCGIVGLPNVGKSTLFNALTQAGIAAENYPFCTIDPNVGIVPVPDPRLEKISTITKSQQTVPTTVQFVDIAGLVAGASKGEGLGNQFLATIRETQAIAHVVRCFDNDDITHVCGKINPAHDIEIINTELSLSDLASLEKVLLKVNKEARANPKGSQSQLNVLEQAKQQLNQGKPLRALHLSKDLLEILAPYQFLTLKPTLYIANVDENGFENNTYLNQVKKIAEEECADIVAVCAALEAEITELGDDEQEEFLASLNLTEPGLNRVIRAGYHLLHMQTYFTTGPKETRAWTMTRGMTAPQAAGVIHTDFEKGFIRAEVIGYEDFIQCHGEQGAKEAGKWRLEGKDYIVQDGDIMLFRFNV